MTHKPHQMMVGTRTAGYMQGPDFYETPPEATLALLGREAFYGGVWEPACGLGAISQVIAANGQHVVSSDLNDHGYGSSGVDFLAQQKLLAPNIVTNPPFNIATKFIQHALSLRPAKAAFLLRLAFLEGMRRRKLYDAMPPARVLVFSKRLPRMHRFGYEGKKTTSTIAFAWFVWDSEHTGNTELGWL